MDGYVKEVLPIKIYVAFKIKSSRCWPQHKIKEGKNIQEY